MHLATELDLRGAMLIPAGEGMGRHHLLHAPCFFGMADQPLSVVMAITAEGGDRQFKRLEAEDIQLFHIKTDAEFGVINNNSDNYLQP